jgi:hypothetical protein
VLAVGIRNQESGSLAKRVCPCSGSGSLKLSNP